MKLVKDGDNWAYFPDNEVHFLTVNKRKAPVWRDYQYDRLDAACSHVTDYSVAVDAGAHVGLITRQLAERFERVYAFEPNIENYRCLCKNVEHLPNVTTIHAALGAASGRTSTAVDPDNSGNIQLAPATGHGDVPIYALDSYDLRDLGLLKIDVQGYEGQVLWGADGCLHAFAPVVLVEVEPEGKLKRTFDRHGVVDDFFEERSVPCVATIGADRIYVPGPNGVRPYTKYAVKRDYHWGREIYPGLQAAIAHVKNEMSFIGGQLLDIGCGDGALTHRLDAFGIDNNQQALAMARKHGVMCQHLSAYRLRYLNGRFRAVSMFDTFEHLHFQELMLDEIKKLKGCNDLFIFNPDPCQSKWHTREFTGDELVAFVESHGWQCIHREHCDVPAKADKAAKPGKTFAHFRRSS